MHRKASHLLILAAEHHRLCSQCGVLHRDLLCPSSSLRTHHSTCIAIRQDNHLGVLVIAFLDDIVMQGVATSVELAYHFLSDQLSAVGLHCSQISDWRFPQLLLQGLHSLNRCLFHILMRLLVAGCIVGTQAFVAA
jgi:hypothetical protein